MSLERISGRDEGSPVDPVEVPNTSRENRDPPALEHPSKSSDASLVTHDQPSAPSTSQGETPVVPCDASHHNEDELQEHPEFENGSLVQVIDPPLYGVIRMMGTLPNIQGMAAGIELVSQSIFYCCLLLLIAAY